MQLMRLGTVGLSSEAISGILNCVCPDCGGSMGGAGKEFKCRENVRRIGVLLWEQLLSAGFHRPSRKRSH